MTRLATMLAGSPYQGYSYAYPHKSAYRSFDMPLPLCDLWREEDRSSLFLYVHLPFCEMRCGFCNLFTQAQPKAGLVERYLDTFTREVKAQSEALGEACFSRLALGGGTPTFLSIAELERVFALLRGLGVRFGDIPFAIETSPATAEPEKLAFLRQWGVTRISIGVQSFVDAEVAQVARPQTRSEVERALQHLASSGIGRRNIDLIYGLPGQTDASWIDSLNRALAFEPEELFLYPLYVRPVTALGKSGRSWDDQRLGLYRVGRDHLHKAGYDQLSMRMFRRRSCDDDDGPKYCCQDDGMLGLGCGARSYTRNVHYSREYAVGAAGVRAILADYLEQPCSAFAHARYGIRLDGDDQRRRFIIQSLLQTPGLDLEVYRRRFGTPAWDDVSELADLEVSGLAVNRVGRLTLTESGLEMSDVVGPWLASRHVGELMETFELR